MFTNCSSLTELDVSSFDTSNVKSFGNWLTSYVLQLGLPFESASEMYGTGMFGGCTSLTSLDLRNFDTSQVTDMFGLFYNTPNLTEVLVSDKWVTDQVTESRYMFDGSGVSSVTVV